MRTTATISITFGCLSTLLALCLGAMVVATSCEAIATAGATKVVAYEQTKQTQINADANVEIARINADATKKTSAAFSLFYLLRYLAWLSAIAVALWVAVWAKERVLGSLMGVRP